MGAFLEPFALEEGGVALGGGDGADNIGILYSDFGGLAGDDLNAGQLGLEMCLGSLDGGGELVPDITVLISRM